MNLAAGLALYGARVLVIDLDPQGNASTALGVEHREGTPGVYEALIEACRCATWSCRVRTHDGIRLVPARSIWPVRRSNWSASSPGRTG